MNLKKTSIRKFSRNLFSYLKDLPIAVYNTRKKKLVFVVLPSKEAKEYGISTEDYSESIE